MLDIRADLGGPPGPGPLFLLLIIAYSPIFTLMTIVQFIYRSKMSVVCLCNC